MLKTLLFTLFCLPLMFLACSATTPDDPCGITGLWKSRDQHSDRPRSLVAIYKYQDTYYGRMLATYDDNGKIKDTILEQREKAPGIVGHPAYCGMDFIYGVKPMSDNNQKYKGKIVDPEKGKVYTAKFWRSGTILIVRGELWIFGKNIPWQPASESDLPEGFSMSDIKRFIPVIPETL